AARSWADFTTFWIRSASCSFAPFTLTVKLPSRLLPQRSSALQLTVAWPIGNVLPDEGAQMSRGFASPTSVALAAYATTAPLGDVAFTTMFAGSDSDGAVVSWTVTLELTRDELPTWSTAVQLRTVVPIG